MEQCSETSAYKIQTPGNYPEESILKVVVAQRNLEEMERELQRMGGGEIKDRKGGTSMGNE